MANQKAKGSIILEILIVVFFVFLVLSLYIPKKLWDEEDKERELCRNRMTAIWRLEQEYIRKNQVYTDTLDYLINFIKQDTTKSQVMIDTLLFNNPPDSLHNCPSTGLPYILKLREDKLGIKIECPNEDYTIRYYLFFTKKIENHGSITDGEKSWSK